MGQDIRFIRLDDDVCTILNRQADENHQRVSDLANELIRKQLRGGSEPPRVESTDDPADVPPNTV